MLELHTILLHSVPIIVVGFTTSGFMHTFCTAAAILGATQLPPPPGLPPLPALPPLFGPATGGSGAALGAEEESAALSAAASGRSSEASALDLMLGNTGGLQLQQGNGLLGGLGTVMQRLSGLGSVVDPLGVIGSSTAGGAANGGQSAQVRSDAVLGQGLTSRLSAALTQMNVRPSTAAKLQRVATAALSPRITAPFKVGPVHLA